MSNPASRLVRILPEELGCGIFIAAESYSRKLRYGIRRMQGRN